MNEAMRTKLEKMPYWKLVLILLAVRWLRFAEWVKHDPARLIPFILATGALSVGTVFAVTYIVESAARLVQP